jgi:hypothetical protein
MVYDRPENALAISGEVVDTTNGDVPTPWANGDPPPWERLPRETNPAWRAFQVYRDLGLERTMAKAAKALDLASSLLWEWSKRWDWVDRSQAWDAYQQRLKDEAHDLAMQEAALLWERRRLKAAGCKWDVSNKLASVVRRKLESIDDPSKIDINDLIKLATLMNALMDSALATAEGGDDSFDAHNATYEELEVYLKKWGVNVPKVKRSRGISAMPAGHTGGGGRPSSTDVDGTDPTT